MAKQPKKGQPKKPDKHPNVLGKVRELTEQGSIVETGHALERIQEREVLYAEIKYVLVNGHREKAKDRYDERFKEWTYAIKGKTIEERWLRIIVSISDDLILITIIDLDADDE